jgi:hypothetical protein
MKIRAENPAWTPEYFEEPVSLQHFAHALVSVPSFTWFILRYMTSRKFRDEVQAG